MARSTKTRQATDRPTIHLICNAHLDPVWQWDWEEGAAEAVSTFRVAAEFCEQFDGFVFNHNEAVLYEWVAEYEPALFKRIQKLVRQGRWHIMGGWYLQPDCNMPCGEALVRQILEGRRYFAEHFGVRPTTAINFDSFGHSRGLVQIMARSGFDSYIYCRPPTDRFPIPADNYEWVGFDGSSVINCRARNMYNSPRGQARRKVEELLIDYRGRPCAFVLWGMGDHGGGPSRVDLKDLSALIRRRAGEMDIRHSTPEDYFRQVRAEVQRGTMTLPKVARDLNPIFVGCYTSMSRIKQTYRRLENEYFTTEAMATTAAAQRLMPAADAELARARKDLLFAQFHDILPGTSVQPAEQSSLRRMDHGLEILSRVKLRSLLALSGGQKKCPDDQIPLLVYNPHPHAVEAVVACEYQPSNFVYDADLQWTVPTVHDEAGRVVPSQLEKENSTLALDWRKRVVFRATLKASQVNRFNCTLRTHDAPPRRRLKARGGAIRFRNDDGLEVVINTRTGLIDRYRVHGRDALAKGALAPLVVRDNPDPWRMDVSGFGPVEGRFTLMKPAEAGRFAGLEDQTLPAAHVIEDGDVRAVVEVFLKYGQSAICQHYLLPRRGTEVGVIVRVFWQEKNRLLKLALPLARAMVKDAAFVGQTCYGRHDLPTDGTEAAAQQWVAAVSRKADLAVSVVNDGTYGCDLRDGVLRPSLLRSAGYCVHPIMDRPLVPTDRFLPRIDQGERVFRFAVNAGPARQRLASVDGEARLLNQEPTGLCFFPSGGGRRAKAGPILGNARVQVAAFKPAQRGGGHVVRLFNPSDRRTTTDLSVAAIGLGRRRVTLGAFEIRTLKVDGRGKVSETDLMEQRG